MMKSAAREIRTDLISSDATCGRFHPKTASEDFIAKLQISLKECYETEYWLEIAQKADLISEGTAKPALHTCGSIRRMLIASINTTKEHMEIK